MSGEVSGLFDASSFAKADFDAHLFVVQVLDAHASAFDGETALRRLHSDLVQHGDRLKGELVDLLNREYTDFIGLSSNLVGTHEAVDRIQTAVTPLRSQLSTASERIDGVLSTIEGILKEKHMIAVRVRELQMLQYANDTVQELETLLNLYMPLSDDGGGLEEETLLIDDNKNDDEAEDALALYESLMRNLPHDLDGDDDEDSKQETKHNRGLTHNGSVVERAARKIVIAQQLIADGNNFADAQALGPVVQRLDRTLMEILQETFLAALEHQHHAVFIQCLRAATVCERISSLENVFAVEVVRPFITKIFAPTVLQSLLEPPSSKEVKKGNTQTRNTSFEGLVSNIGQEFSLALQLSSEANAFPVNFIANSIWPEVVSALLSVGGPTLFATGMATKFHHNYTSCQRLVRAFEGLFVDSPEHLIEFQNHPTLLVFMKKWNLPIYYELRFRQLAQNLEDSLALDLAEGKEGFASPLSKPVAFSQTVTMLTALETCWGDGVWMPELAGKFFELSLRLVTRYVLFLEQNISSSVDIVASSKDVNDVKSAHSMSIATCLYILVEMQLLATELVPYLSKLMVQASSAVAAKDATAAATAGLDASLKRLEIAHTSLLGHVAKKLVHECQPVLQAVTRIKSNYLHTKKPAPTGFSSFVPLLLGPLRTHLIEHKLFQNALSPADRDHLIAYVANAMTSHYVDVVKELSAVVKKFQDTLKKLQGKKKKAEQDASGSENIKIQLRLDVHEYQRMLVELQVAQKCEALPELVNLVA